MQRITLEILKSFCIYVCDEESVLYDYRLWLIELVEDDAGIYRLYRYYGYNGDAELTKKLDLSTEHIDIALVAFKSKLKEKLSEKKFRLLKNGEGLTSRAILSVLKPKPATKVVAVKTPKQIEHRKLQL